MVSFSYKIHYFTNLNSEILIKSKNLRKIFKNPKIKNLKNLLKNLKLSHNLVSIYNLNSILILKAVVLPHETYYNIIQRIIVLYCLVLEFELIGS